jgi:glycine/D-amino acid oxidase-like deaminating enzyme
VGSIATLRAAIAATPPAPHDRRRQQGHGESMMQPEIFAPGYRSEPFWWEAAPRPALPSGPPPSRADVVVIGSGYTGLAAALAAARGGRDTLVLEAGELGTGCSTRNGGQVSTSIKPGFAELAGRHGPDRAYAMLREGHNALAFIADFIAAEGIDCDWQRVGRFLGAHAPAQYEALARRLASQPRGLEVEAHMVPRSEQAGEIGTALYHGGAVFEQHAALHPARFHQGLLDRALAAGTRVVPRCPAQAIRRGREGFTVATPQGPIAARDVVVATNGYTGPENPGLRRRVIPIGSYIIATEPLAPAVVARLIPRGRVISDTRHVVFYYRLCPQHRRMIFGGRVALAESDPRVTAPRLHAAMVALFPELARVRITHSWHGFVAYTFDTMPHLGRRDGVHYAMGYCGSGVSLATYFGTRIGQQLLGLAEGRTALDDLPFPTRPFYSGRPWFLIPTLAWYQLRDWMGR